MNDSLRKKPAQDHKALELTLHDGLDRLEEFALMLAFQGTGQQFEILSITPPAEPVEAAPPPPRRRAENVVCLHRARLKKTA
ncbi:MAG TPA: hypothetical protein ENJ17_04060 [Gammaproteobacteria bacterium]|nr:hypothetical protein [Gammaproteobacteria bacterium]